jgi:hypothetical protein
VGILHEKHIKRRVHIYGMTVALFLGSPLLYSETEILLPNKKGGGEVCLAVNG